MQFFDVYGKPAVLPLLSMLVFLSLITVSGSFAQTGSKTISGLVVDEKNQPLEFATVYVEALDRSFATDKNGRFKILLPNSLKEITLRITSVGRKTVHERILLKEALTRVRYTLKNNSLTLEDVKVSPLLVAGTHSNSSIVFDEEAIERTQAFSLMDVLNQLPGKASSAPTIDAPQTITLRGSLDNEYAMNNSLGIPIIVDGVRLSNDANMQSTSVSQWGMQGSILSGAHGTSSSDVPFQGMDLRDIPVENIERIEVIQGVASAEFGELTDGAIIVHTKAGRSPYHFTTNVNGASTNFSLSKGYALPGNLGAVNLGLNYARSNTDPRDKLKQYDRYGLDLKWSKTWKGGIRNTFSLHGDKKADNYFPDPDDGSLRSSFSKNHNIRISNRLNWDLKRRMARNMSLTLAFSKGRQHSYKQWLINQSPRPYTFKDTTGIYEGVILSGRYIAVEEILGKPLTGSAHLKLSTAWGKENFHHALSYGAQINYSNNGGKGIIADPNRPRWVGRNDQNLRPYAFEQIDPLINTGVYVMDNMKFPIWGKTTHANLGLRLDHQNRSTSLQPRISIRTELTKHWNTSLSFGIATKSPTLAHRSPAPSWIDIPLVVAFNSNDALYLVYSERFETENPDLKPSRSTQLEYGLGYKDAWGSIRLNAYYKANRGGFNSVKTFRTFHLPAYDYYVNADGKFEYEPNGSFTDFYDIGDYRILNVNSSDHMGIDLLWDVRELKAISTSIYGNTALIYSKENSYPDVVALTAPVELNGENIWHAVYPKRNQKGVWSMTSKISTTTHLPRLGFILMSTTDIFWLKHDVSTLRDPIQRPTEYIDSRQQWHPVTSDIAHLFPGRDVSLSDQSQPFVYASFNLSVAKEIKKRIRISITAYNVLNIRPEYRRTSASRPDEYVITTYNQPVSLTGGISFKF